MNVIYSGPNNIPLILPKYYIPGLGYSPASSCPSGGGLGVDYSPDKHMSTFFGSDVKSLLPNSFGKSRKLKKKVSKRKVHKKSMKTKLSKRKKLLLKYVGNKKLSNSGGGWKNPETGKITRLKYSDIEFLCSQKKLSGKMLKKYGSSCKNLE